MEVHSEKTKEQTKGQVVRATQIAHAVDVDQFGQGEGRVLDEDPFSNSVHTFKGQKKISLVHVK